MSVNGKFQGITRKDLLTVADRFGIGEAALIIADVRRAIKAWPSFAKRAGVSRKDLEYIQRLHWISESPASASG